MCGILGQINIDEVRINKNSFKNALSTQKHRGPDRTSHYFNENIALGHVRLSIIDVDGGHQPLEIDDYVIVFNGEIYNYQLLKKNLIQDGVKFTSNSDTEVILRGYIHHGESFLSLLNGMFSLSIYNRKKNNIIIFRDHTGQKPLYYFIDDKRLIFSSEISPIMDLIPNLRINPIAIDAFLHLSYIPATFSILTNVHKIRPGSCLRLCINTGERVDTIIQHKETNQNLKDLIEQTAIADVDIGLSLSAGIDSSLILSLLNQKIKKTYNVSSHSFHTNDLLNEGAIAEWFAKSKNVDFKMIDFKNLTFDEVNEHIDCFDEPYADSSSLMARYVAMEAKKDKIKVILTGDGADELFGGYRKHVAFLIMRYFLFLPHIIRKVLAYLIPNEKIGAILKNSNNAKELYWNLSNMGIDIYKNKKLMNSSRFSIMNSVLGDYKINTLNDLLNKDRSLLLEGDMMVKGDRVYMKYGIEARPVFATPSLLNLVKKIPANKHLSLFGKKIVLREFAKKYLPGKILNKPKTGFDAPLSKIPIELIKRELKKNLKNKEYIIYDDIVNSNNWLDYLNKLDTSSHKGKRDLYVVYSLFRWLLKNKKYFSNSI